MKEKIYINGSGSKPYNTKSIILEIVLDVVVYAIILLMASTIFNNFYVENVWYALVASSIIGILNLTIKPFLIYITMPLTVVTLGIFYPFVNIIVMKLASWLLGSHFVVEGWFVAFFIAIFISVMKILFEVFIIKPIVERN